MIDFPAVAVTNSIFVLSFAACADAAFAVVAAAAVVDDETAVGIPSALVGVDP
jgi:hypothetical protein